jgi:hypothetical protein
VLQALADECPKATFFEIGQHAMWHPEVTKQVIEAGMTVGAHTWSHKDLARNPYANDIEQAEQEIETHEHDVVIRLSGEILKRKKKLSKKYYGTSHVVSKDEAKFVFERGCEQLIVGSGQMGNVHLSPEAEAYFAKKGCKVLLQPTPEATMRSTSRMQTRSGFFTCPSEMGRARRRGGATSSTARRCHLGASGAQTHSYLFDSRQAECIKAGRSPCQEFITSRQFPARPREISISTRTSLVCASSRRQ